MELKKARRTREFDTVSVYRTYFQLLLTPVTVRANPMVERALESLEKLASPDKSGKLSAD